MKGIMKRNVKNNGLRRAGIDKSRITENFTKSHIKRFVKCITWWSTWCSTVRFAYNTRRVLLLGIIVICGGYLNQTAAMPPGDGHFFCPGMVTDRPAFQFQLSSVLQSHMVIQQNKPFKIWGHARPGARIRINADWANTALDVFANAEGRFEGILDVPKARPGDYRSHEVLVSSGGQEIQLKDLLIGDLWLISGQSNMQFAVREMLDSTHIINSADNPHIRLLNVALNFSKVPIDSIKGDWEVCTPSTVRGFSAVGYSFGAKLQKELNIPIGLVFSGIGASTVQAFVPEAALKRDTLLNRVYLQPYLQDPKSREVVDAGFSFEKVTRPFLLYNALIHPLTRLSIKGICWYQGETNFKERESYTQATIQMIKSWREQFRQGNLPFEFVQIAPYAHEKLDPKLVGDAFFREAQEKILALNNTNMVLTLDVGDPNNLHPKNKRPVGERLAAVALNRTYGRLDVAYLGPQFSYANFKANSAVVHFLPETVASGLTTNNGKAPSLFTMAGADQVFYPATATIQGNTIILHSDKVPRPVAVRYAFFNYPVTHLQNGAGLPAAAFRTDHWAEKPE